MDLPLQRGEVGHPDRRLRVHQDIAGLQLPAAIPSTVDFSYPALGPLTNDRLAHLARDGDTQAWLYLPLLTFQDIDGHQPSVAAASPLVAAQEIGSFS